MDSNLFSTSRLPADNFLSGSLVGFITGSVISINQVKKGEISSKEATKKIIKFSIQSGIATGFGIWASNDIVKRKYLDAGLKATLAISLIKISNNILKENI